MDKEKEIEEMAKFCCIHKNRECKTCCTYVGGVCIEHCAYHSFAERLQEAGYGNVKQSVREFAEKLKEELWKFDGSWQEYDGEELCETVDKLITELYGADE